MRTALALIAAAAAALLVVIKTVDAQRHAPQVTRPGSFDETIAINHDELFRNGQQIFRFDTFGDEAFWSGALKLHQAIAGAANGGVGPGVSPATALAVGLKVDADMVPPQI